MSPRDGVKQKKLHFKMDGYEHNDTNKVVAWMLRSMPPDLCNCYYFMKWVAWVVRKSELVTNTDPWQRNT
jgi:hypothetical protein